MTWRRCLFHLLVQILATVALVFDPGFLGGDPPRLAGDPALAATDLFVDLGNLRVQGQYLGFARLGGSQGSPARGGNNGRSSAFYFGQPLVQAAASRLGRLACGALAADRCVPSYSPCLAGLGSHAVQAAFHFVDNVRQTE